MATKPKKIPMRFLLWWHRHIGLTVAIVAIHLAITGILLNHTSDIGLDKAYINNSTVLNLYDIKLPEQLTGYKIKNNWLSHWNDVIYFNDQVIAESMQPLRGAVITAHFYALATSEEIWLLTIDGEIIEKISAPGEKLGDIVSIGTQGNNVTINTEQGVFKADNDLIAWQPVKADSINWSQQAYVPKELTELLFAEGHSISWERLLLDLHSGRIATRAGTLLVDLAGVALLLLAITGFTIWLKRRKK